MKGERRLAKLAKRWNKKSYPRGKNRSSTLPNLPRTEREVFADLSGVCIQPGYIHALSYLIYRDTIITGGEEFTKDDFLKIYSPKRLIRTEFSLLIGLMLKSDIDLNVPAPDVLQTMIDSTDRLMEELHRAVIAVANQDFVQALNNHETSIDTHNPLKKGNALREAIFYGGESAFTWHYLNFSKRRYSNDNAWLAENVGFTIEDAVHLTTVICDHLSAQLIPRLKNLRKMPMREWTMLPMFQFSKQEIVNISGLDEGIVTHFLDAYTVPRGENNEMFSGQFSRNIANIYPFMCLSDDIYTSFLEYSTTESIYDNAFYWMVTDDKYRGSAAKNRGQFAENLTFEFLDRVFPEGAVYRNIIFRKSKSKIEAEADALIIFGSRAFVFQIKSKKLTETAKAGDELAISRDFQSAIQKAYDQSIACIDALRAGTSAYQPDGEPIAFNLDKVGSFYPVCITSEHYPALSFQVAQFLKVVDDIEIQNPLIFDLFTLDIITEFLRSPLYLLDYLHKRSIYHNRIRSSHELVLLSYHLRRNLYLPPDYQFMMVEDDFLVDLDLAVHVRRRGIPGAATPPGLLTRNLDTPLGYVLEQIDKSVRPEIHQIGELILGLSGEAYEHLDGFIERVIDLTRDDGNNHDVTIPIEEDETGITVHCNLLPPPAAAKLLRQHCELRKYTQRAGKWFGLCLWPNGEIKLALGVKSPWQYVHELEKEVADFKARAAPHWIGPDGLKSRTGRNAPCPCGSGLKNKRCHDVR